MDNVLRICLIAFVVGFREVLAAIPSDVVKCRAGDVSCIAKTATDVLRRNPKGNADLGLVHLEPIHLKHMVVAESHGRSAIQLNFNLTNFDIYGLSQTVLTNVIGFEKDPRTSRFEVHGRTPEIKLKGHYVANGRILFLPIIGDGDAEIVLKDVKTGVKFKPTISDKNGKLQIGVQKIKVKMEPEDLKIRLDNLFNGNKELGTEMNRIINTNWRDVWSEIEAGINNGITEVLKTLLVEVFKKVTYDDFYTD